MGTFLEHKNQLSEKEVIKIASDCLGQEIASVAKIGKGGNSKVYHLKSSYREFVVKFYFQHPSDTRDRLGVEFQSLSFLWGEGLRMVPRPIVLNREHQCAFYDFIKGTSPVTDISSKDIDGAVQFLGVLKNLALGAKDLNFPAASEAFFCGMDIMSNIRGRLKRFSFNDNTGEYLALREFLRDEFMPLLETVETWSKLYLVNHGILWEEKISGRYRTLSPSDFGFHNALRTPDESIVFLDFEYFGWDDPAKLVSDFLWHPAMSLTHELKEKFLKQMMGIFDDPQFKNRLKAFYPLFGLKWCLILLNEFVAVDMQRRGFARLEPQDITAVRLSQLARARTLIQQISNNYKVFYDD